MFESFYLKPKDYECNASVTKKLLLSEMATISHIYALFFLVTILNRKNNLYQANI